jgi:membrane-bound metal-dependent hydrolase YbcI (DUF457 family)
MLGKTHLVTGVTSASWMSVLVAATGAPPAVVLGSAVVGAYSALIPDLDQSQSMASWSLPPISNFVSWVIRGCPWRFFRWGGWLLPLWLTISSGHRRETHSEEFAGAAGVLVALALLPFTWWSWAFGVQVATGCITHMWGDSRTTSGLRCRGGAPSDRRHIGRTIFKTGSDYELWLRYTRYQPIAIVSVIAALIFIAMITGPVTQGVSS